MKNNKRCMVLYILIFLNFNLVCDEILAIKYYKKDQFPSFSINEIDNEFDNYDISSDIFLPVSIIPAKQEFLLVENSNENIQVINDYGNCNLLIFKDEIKYVENRKLVKSLIYRKSKKTYYPGVCIYIDLDNNYNKSHTYINDEYVSTVFDENGKNYIFVDSYKGLFLYELTNVDLENGGLYKSTKHLFVNYINISNKKVMFYTIDNGEAQALDNIPVLTNPVLYYGYNKLDPVKIEELGLKPLIGENHISTQNVVYRRILDGRHPDGTKYYLDTIYLLDYDSQGNRKKGVYKLMGDKYEFYPDL